MRLASVRVAGLVTLTSLAAGLLSACNFAPDYSAPDIEKPAAYKEADGTDWKAAEPADALSRGQWWTMFGDPTLDGLEAKVADANQNLKAAFARFEQARAEAEIARAQYYPTLGSNGQFTRQQISKTIANTRPENLYNDGLFNLDFSYEVDLWGRVRNSVASAEAQAQASAGDLASLDLSIRAELASDYFTIRGDDTQQTVLDETVKAYQKAYDLTVKRHDGGAVAEADVDQAETQLENARTQAEDTRLRRAQLEHAIAILIGVPPASFSLPAEPLHATPPAVDPGLPASLVERRPDVAAAERRAASANANIGVARAAFFPQLNLSAMGGFESASAARLFTKPSRTWSVGPVASLPIFDGFQRNGVLDQAHAEFDEAAANYRQNVLDAFRDVEDNLAALRQLEKEAATQAGAVASSGRALNQAQLRYTGGLVTYLEVVTNENTALQAQLAAADIAARRMTASVALVKALGGGWNADTGLKTDAVAATAPMKPAAPLNSAD
jgi:NodT family efflux transporter outer membrane factor (OMF) lipoprotein